LGKEKPPILQKVDEERTMSQRLMKLLPGWRGYRIKEERRNADRILRDQLKARLSHAQESIKDIRTALVEAKLEDDYTAIDSLTSRTERLISQISHADYGYRPYFDEIKIREDDLMNMLRFDTWFVEQVQEFDRVAKEAADSVSEDSATALKQIKDLGRMMTEMIGKWKSRTDVILGVQPV
jgi:hypothetical protein